MSPRFGEGNDGNDAWCDKLEARDRSDATVVTERTNGSARRTVYEPRSDGRVDVVEETLTKSGEWREVGHQIADSVSVE